MAATSRRQLWKQQGLAILVLAFLVGLPALPAADDAPACSSDAFKANGLRSCEFANRSEPFSEFGMIQQSKCCSGVGSFRKSPDLCSCAIAKSFAAQNIDLKALCPSEKIDIEGSCKAAQRKAKDAKKREDELSQLKPCGRLFARLGAGEASKITTKDATECALMVEKCATSCKTQ